MPILALILACAFWAISFPILRALHLEQSSRLPDASSGFLAAWIQMARFALGSVIILPVVLRLPRPTRAEMQQGLQLGLWGGLGMGLQADALAYTDASTSAFLTQAYCVLLPLWAALRSRRRPALRVVGATLLVIVGGSALSGIRPGNLSLGRGEAETLLASCFFAVQILCLENPKYLANRGRPVTFVMCMTIFLLSIPVTAYAAPSASAMITAGASWPTLLMIGLLALVCTVGAYLLMNTWQRRVTATEAGLIYTAEPVFAAGFALFLPAFLGTMAGVDYPNEILTPALLVGGVLILSANLWMQWRRPPHSPTVAPIP